MTTSAATPDLRPLFWPKRVAVIGASEKAEGLRSQIMRVMLLHDFDGEILPISRSEDTVFGLAAYPTITAAPGPVDLAIIIIPAPHVPKVLAECGAAGVRAAQIITSGFAEEVVGEGEALQDEICAIAEKYSMAVVGPNSEGFANTRSRLCPTFSPAVEVEDGESLLPPESDGRLIGVVAQSGGIGFSFLDRARPKRLPVGYVLSTGNEACLETFDVVEWMLEEGEVQAFILFCENVKDPAKFRRAAARALAEGKPLIVVKIGRSEAGVRAAMSHTAALAGAYAGYSAVFARYGVIEVANIEEAVDIAGAFVAWRDREATGMRVGIFTGSGGAGGWMADGASLAGLDVPELDAETRARIDTHLPSYGSSRNPVDATAQAVGRLGYAGLLELLLDSPSLDAVVAIASARLPRRLENDRENLVELRARSRKPVAFWSYTLPHPRSIEILSRAGYPLFTNSTHLARALAEFVRYRRHRERYLAERDETVAIASDAAPAVAGALAAAGPVLAEHQAKPLLAHYGIAAPFERLVHSGTEAAEAQAAAGGPVALKLQSADLPHKSDLGLVLLEVADGAAARAGYECLCARVGEAAPQASVDGVLVQAMAADGVEMIVGISRDETFGPLVTVGLGGIFAEILQDAATLPAPVSPSAAGRMIEGLTGAAILRGARARPPADVAALAEIVARLSHLAADHAGEIAEIDLNPVIVHEQGASVVDALIVKRSARGYAPPKQIGERP